MPTYRRGSESGQGLVEYALIFALVAIAVIVLLAATGQKVGELLCDVIIKTGAKIPPNIAMCAAPRVTISGLAGGQRVSGRIVVEAIIQDDKIQQANDILSVTFYLDSTTIRTSHTYPYCLNTTDSGCGGFDSIQWDNGPHKFRVVAEDADHNIGETSVPIIVQN